MKIKNKDSGNKKLKKQDIQRIDYPVFSFRYLHRDLNITNCRDKENFLLRLELLSKKSWLDCINGNKHGYGSEKIKQSSINVGTPDHITKDVDFLSFRYSGKIPFVGYMEPTNKFIFQVVYIANDYNKPYKH